MDSSQSILFALLDLHKRMDAQSMVNKYSSGQLDQYNFVSMMKSIMGSSVPDSMLSKFYKDTIESFRAPNMTPFVINQLVKRAMILKNVKRNPSEIMQLVSQAIQSKQQDIDRVFKIFDFDGDNSLEETEFRCLLEYNLPTITPNEYRELRIQYPSNRISLQDLSNWLQLPVGGMSKIIPNKPNPNTNTKGRDSPMLPTPDNSRNQQQIQQPTKPQPNRNEGSSNNTPRSSSNNFKPGLKHQHSLRGDDNFEDQQISIDTPGAREYLETKRKLQSSNQQFTDPQFPPNENSLGAECRGYQWKRLSEVWGKDFQVFVKEEDIQSNNELGQWISPDDIEQGELGDCYFLSTLSSLAARWPEIVQSLIITATTNDQGIYAVKFCIDGIWKVISLDDYVPVKGNNPAFSHSHEDEAWVLFLEKAWAKSFGSYSNIIAGDSREVFKSIMAGPTWVFKTDQPDFKDQFFKYVKRDCLMTCGTHAQQTDYKALGLVPGHAYSILGVAQVNHPQYGKVDLVEIRNPWGQTEWKGDWSDNSHLWTADIKRQLNIQDGKDDGIFYMDLKDLMKNFGTVFTAYFKQDYIYQSIPLKSNKKQSKYFQFDIPQDGEYYFTVHQPSSRHFKDKYTNYKYSAIRMLLGRITQNGYEFTDSRGQALYDCCVGKSIPAGRYLLQAKVTWNYQNEGEFAFSNYGVTGLNVQVTQKDPKFVNQVLLSKARQNPNQKAFIAECQQIYSCSDMDIKSGFGYFYYVNKSNKTLEMTSQLNAQGLKLVKPERGNQFTFTLPPNSEKLIVTIVNPSGYSLSQSFSYGLR